MKNLILSALFIIFCLFCKPCFAQQSNTIDSLENVLKAAREDTNKVNTLNIISTKYINKGDYDKGIQFANDALLLSEKINYQKGIADFYYQAGVTFNPGKADS